MMGHLQMADVDRTNKQDIDGKEAAKNFGSLMSGIEIRISLVVWRLASSGLKI